MDSSKSPAQTAKSISIKQLIPGRMLCPYCLNRLHMSDLEKFCPICDKPQGQNRGNLLERMTRRPVACATPGCDGHYTIIKCKKCGKILPSSIGQYSKYMSLAIIAPSGAGKTVFITTMINELYQNSQKLGLNISPLNKKTKEYQDDNYSLLYLKRCKLDATSKGDIRPMQWQIQNTRLGERASVPTYSLTMFDGAGEDQNNVEKKMDSTISRYIAESKMLLLLLDPVKLSGVRSFMNEDAIIQSGGSPDDQINRGTTQDFINNIINYIKIASGTRIDRKLETPVAVTFAKMDMMTSFFLQVKDPIVFQPSSHVEKGHFDEEEANKVHEEIDDWLTRCGDDISSTFNNNFKNWRYFGASSFGVMPEKDGNLSKAPKPLRVLDPLLWNFKLEKIRNFK